MTNIPKKSGPTSVIKWIDEEWELIAQRLYATKGPNVIVSEHLEEIKAKDVFHAQIVLPESRHRKLISISQGFNAIRQRLHLIFQKMEKSHPVSFSFKTLGNKEYGDSGDSTHAQNNSTTAATTAGDRTIDRSLELVLVAPSNVFDYRPPQPKAAENFQSPSRKKQGRELGFRTAGHAGETLLEVSKAVPDKVSRLESTHLKVDIGSGESVLAGRNLQQSAEGTNRAASEFQRQAPLSKTKPALLKPLTNEVSRSASAPTDWIDIVRPLVAMVCEEFVQALVKEVTQRVPGKGLSSCLDSSLLRSTPDPTHSLQGARHREIRYPVKGDNTGDTEDSSPRVESPQAASHYGSGSEDESGQFAEVEVQPLFDPKLPPSANSSFKPTIGVIVTHAYDFEDLQQIYPQLRLVLVLPDAVRSASGLRDCQRVIGLRENVPLPTDEYLRNTFKNRYVRINGGIERIREQLNSWLDKPGSINPSPGKPLRRNDGNGNNKSNYPKGSGKNIGEGANKKRHIRYPRPMR